MIAPRQAQVDKIERIQRECESAKKGTPHHRDLVKHLRREQKQLILYDKLHQKGNDKKMAKAGKKQLEYIGRWNKENTKAIVFRLNKTRDADIIDRLKAKGVAPYLKRLVREDIAKAEEE